VETRTFGRRSAGPRDAARAPFTAPPGRPSALPAAIAGTARSPARTFHHIEATAEDGYDTLDRDMLADIPLVTMGLVIALIFIYAAQLRLAFDVNASGGPSLLSLVSQGATSYKMVVGDGQWWRMFLAPLLHSGTMHLFGNCIALLLVGIRLEPQVGRGWFSLIFVASALTGSTLSILYNAADIPGVGASGGISGLVVALFVASFFADAGAEERWRMQRMALFFGGPALLPLLYSTGGSTDYFAHGGGALAGGLITFLLKSELIFDEDDG
jgi:rhomboid protease GluP